MNLRKNLEIHPNPIVEVGSPVSRVEMNAKGAPLTPACPHRRLSTRFSRPRAVKIALTKPTQSYTANILDHALPPGGKKYIFFQLEFSSGGRAPLPAMILAGRNQRRNPGEVRSSLSQSPSRCASLPPAGQTAATRSSYADARCANEIRSLVTAGAASRPTTSITTGFGSIVADAPIAGRPSPSFRCSLFLTHISVCWRAARHCYYALWSIVRGRRHRPR